MGATGHAMALQEKSHQTDRYDSGERGGRHLAEIDQPIPLEERDVPRLEADRGPPSVVSTW